MHLLGLGQLLIGQPRLLGRGQRADEVLQLLFGRAQELRRVVLNDRDAILQRLLIDLVARLAGLVDVVQRAAQPVVETFVRPSRT